jgi:DegV family protein with EDD domain
MQAALTACANFTAARVYVVDSRSLSVGQGLLVQEARAMAAYGADGARIVQRLEELRGRLKLFFSLKSLDFAHRGGRVSFATNFFSKMLAIKPVIAFDAEGRVVSVAKAFGEHGVQTRLVSMALQEWKRYKTCRMAVAHVCAPELAEHYVEEIKSATGLRDVPVAEATPAIGAHAGPGAAGIAVLGLD